MPLSLLSGQKGTRILSGNSVLFPKPLSRPLQLKSNAKSHVPFRFVQSSLTNCGNGCSALGIVSIKTSILPDNRRYDPRQYRPLCLFCLHFLFFL